MNPPPLTLTLKSSPFHLSPERTIGSDIFTRAISGVKVLRGIPLMNVLPEPFFTMARAIAVFLFPLTSNTRFFSTFSGFSGFSALTVSCSLNFFIHQSRLRGPPESRRGIVVLTRQRQELWLLAVR